MRLPGGWRTQNPFRSTYFAAQAMAAEMSTGAPAMVLVQAAPASVAMILREIQAVFTEADPGAVAVHLRRRRGDAVHDRAGRHQRRERELHGAIGGTRPRRRARRRVPRDLVLQAALVSASTAWSGSSWPAAAAAAWGATRRSWAGAAPPSWTTPSRTLEAVCSDVRVLSGLQRRYTDRGRAVVVDAAPEAGPLGRPRRRPRRGRAAAGDPARGGHAVRPRASAAVPGRVAWRAGTWRCR